MKILEPLFTRALDRLSLGCTLAVIRHIRKQEFGARHIAALDARRDRGFGTDGGFGPRRQRQEQRGTIRFHHPTFADECSRNPQEIPRKNFF